MSNVWYCIPSARPDGGTLRQWRDRGYNLAVWRDPGAAPLGFEVGLLAEREYPGYAKAVNLLAGSVLYLDLDCDWIVTGGDDVSPDMAHSPEEIAEACTEHFGGTFGVMQPTGDRWGADEPWARQMYPNEPAYIDRICGSPWLGREFCRRANQGRGPLCEDYEHMYVDEHLQEYAKGLGILWQRRDLIHYHEHALRKKGASMADLPPHLKCRYEGNHFAESKKILDRHKASQFAGCEPIE